MMAWFSNIWWKIVGWLLFGLVILGFLIAIFLFGLRIFLNWLRFLKEIDREKVAHQTRIGAIILVAVIVILFILWKMPKWQVANLKYLPKKELFDKENEARKIVAQILGGLALIIGIYLTWRRITATEKNLEIARDGQITERFTRAIEQLGNVNLEMRIGGIYALERIARDSEKDHWTIMEVLTAYVRENTRWPPKVPTRSQETQINQSKESPGTNQPDQPSTMDEEKTEEKPQEGETKLKPRADIQAILTVLGRRERRYEERYDQRLDLKRTDLRGADLKGAHLEGANLKGSSLAEANLEGAKLREAHLEGAILEGAHLEKARLWDTNLEGANLIGAHLKEARLSDTNLEGAILQKADFRKAKYLKKDQVILARCWPLAFFDAVLLKELGLPQNHNERLSNNDLSGYNLEGADLRGAALYLLLDRTNLKGAHLKGSKLWANLEGRI